MLCLQIPKIHVVVKLALAGCNYQQSCLYVHCTRGEGEGKVIQSLKHKKQQHSIYTSFNAVAGQAELVVLSPLLVTFCAPLLSSFLGGPGSTLQSTFYGFIEAQLLFCPDS